MKYKDLSAKRRLVVDLLLKEGYMDTDGLITFSSLQDFWSKYKTEKRDFGYPLWITVEKEWRTSCRGAYKVPAPNSNDTLTEAPKQDMIEEIEFPNDEYQAIIKAAGIKPKKQKGL